MPDASARMQERMKTMTPERRKQFEEMMKQHGVDVAAGNVMKICYSQKMVERGSWSDQSTCKTEYSNRSASAWKWHSTCPAVNYEGDGEASFPDSENFTVKSSGVVTTGGKPHASSSVRTGKMAVGGLWGDQAVGRHPVTDGPNLRSGFHNRTARTLKLGVN